MGLIRWRILALLVFARVALGFQFQTLASVGDDLVVSFGLDYADIGLLVGLFMLPGLVLAMPAGFFGRFLSDRTLAALGLAALALGGVVSGLAVEGRIVGLGRVLSGTGFVFSSLYFTKMVADWFDGREIATAMSVLVVSWPLGIAMGQVGHAWLAEIQSWRAPFYAASAYCALAGLGVLVFYRPHRKPQRAEREAPTALSGREWRLILAAGAAWGAFNAGYVVYLGFGPKMLEAQGRTALAAATVVSLGSWLMIASGTVCGLIADRFGRRNTILTICMAGAVAALWLASLPGAGLAASLLFGLIGMAPAGVIMALAGAAVQPERRAFAMGVFFTVYYAIMTAVPPLAGAILDRTGNAQAPLVLAMVLFAAVLPAALAFRHAKAAAPIGGIRQEA